MRALTLKALLESPGLRWPPESVAPRWSVMAEYRRYYFSHSGDLFAHRPDLHADGSDVGRFTPVPLAKEIANFSAALLFGEPATITALEAGDQAALDELTDNNRLDELLTAAAEYVAVEGAGGLRVSLDDGVPGGVVLDYVPGDRVMWRERFGRFTSGGIVCLEIKERNTTWRLLEDHDVGHVTRRLFKGNVSRLGDAVPLNTGPEEWRELKPETVTNVLDRATLVKWENKPGSVSDLAGILPMLDSYDDGMTMIRRKSDASVPIIAGHESLADENREFHAWRGITLQTPDEHVASSLIPADKLVQVLQAAFEATPMIEYLTHLRGQIVGAAGYSPESFTGEGIGGSAESGRALALRQTRTSHTANQKATMTERAVSEALGVALALFLGRPLAEPCMPVVELMDTVEDVAEEVAEEQDPPNPEEEEEDDEEEEETNPPPPPKKTKRKRKPRAGARRSQSTSRDRGE